MAGRWRDPSAFRADPAAAPAAKPSARQSISLLAVLVLVAGTVALASYIVRPDRARAFDLFHGSIFLADQVAPVGVDLASGKPTLRLVGADKQVGVSDGQGLSVVPLDGGTLLLNTGTGEFNMVDDTGFVIKHDGGGVPLTEGTGNSSSVGIASGAQAYIERTGPDGTDVFLVGQPTVQSAINAQKSVTARASISMPLPGSTAPGGAASANGDLWLLAGGSGDGGTRTLWQLRVPRGSSAGATLHSIDHGTVDGPAAVGTARSAGATSVGVASADGIDVFAPDGTSRTAAFAGLTGVDTILPAQTDQDRIAFLIHSAAGWSVASVSADGSDLRGPTQLTDVARNAALAPPVVSGDQLYTLDRDNGQVVRVGYDGAVGTVPGARSYPLARSNGTVAETGGFADAYLTERGSRVLIDSPSHVDALAVFTDGSQAPRVIQKNQAVDVSAAGGAEALTKPRVTPGQPNNRPPPKTGAAPPKTVANQPINNRIDCATAKQKPHVPVITQATPGSRSVALSWHYPLLDSQDCAPSTYVVSVELISSGAPAPPSTARVQSQTGTNLTGLYPSTQYEITLTAYLDEEGAASDPVRVTTGPEGPAAPTALAVAADAAGNWTVHWNSCGGVDQGCVPAASWQVIPSICDGRGLSTPPTPVDVTADPTAKAQPPVTYAGGDALLGRGLRFQVEGAGANGTVGTPSGKSACVYSWSPPDASAITLAATTHTTAAYGQSNDAIVTLHFAGDATVDSGGVGAQYTYHLTGGGQTRTIGPTDKTAVTFSNAVAAGSIYSATATVSPPRHSGAAVTIGPQQVQTSSAWPSMSISSASVSSGSDLSSGTLTFTLNGLSSQGAGGERFDAAAIDIRCQNADIHVDPPNNFDPADGPITTSVSGIQPDMYNSSCTLSLTLTEHPASETSPPFFGGTNTSAPDASVSMPSQSASDLGDPGLSARFEGTVDSSDRSVLDVSASIGDRLSFFTHDWSETVHNGHGDASTTDCGVANAAQSTSIDVKQECVQQSPSAADWTVKVEYTSYLDGHQSQTVQVAASPDPPSYQPPPPPPVCNVDQAGLTAQWSGTTAAPSVTMGVTDAGQIKDCSNWSYTVVAPTTPDCGDATGAPDSSPPPTIALTCADPPATPGWTVAVTYNDANGDPQTTPPVDVTGPTPP